MEQDLAQNGCKNGPRSVPSLTFRFSHGVRAFFSDTHKVITCVAAGARALGAAPALCDDTVYRCPTPYTLKRTIAGLAVALSGALLSVIGEGYHESRRCSRDTYPESYITKFVSIRRLSSGALGIY